MPQDQHVNVFRDCGCNSDWVLDGRHLCLYLIHGKWHIIYGSTPCQRHYIPESHLERATELEQRFPEERCGAFLSAEWQINYYLENNPNLKVVAISAVYISHDSPADVYVVFQGQKTE